MPLALTSAVAADVAAPELDEACRTRGLDGIELALDRAADAIAVASRLAATKTRVVALRAESLPMQHVAALAEASAALGVPVSVPSESIERRALPTLARTFSAAGGRLLVGEATDLAAMTDLATAVRAAGSASSLGIAWELRPSSDRLADAGAILFAAGDRLGLVRLRGGGPEQRGQDGRGLGSLVADLALVGYAGPIVLCPTDPAQLPRWRAWLTSRGAAGCGHGKDARAIDLDVRDVEPRDRLATILGAYHALGPGATLHLTVDHDPCCMYYTLEATEPTGSFEFRTVEHGPEVWRAEVTRR